MSKYIAVFFIYFVFIWFSPLLGAGLMNNVDMVINTFYTLVSTEYIFDAGNYQLLITTVSSIILTCITFKEIPA